jgi:hypothetical protein
MIKTLFKTFFFGVMGVFSAVGIYTVGKYVLTRQSDDKHIAKHAIPDNDSSTGDSELDEHIRKYKMWLKNGELKQAYYEAGEIKNLYSDKEDITNFKKWKKIDGDLEDRIYSYSSPDYKP